MVNRGFVPSLCELAQLMLGGSVDPEVLRTRLEDSNRLLLMDGLVYPPGQEELFDHSLQRKRSYVALRDRYTAIAREFAADLASYCPFVKTIALCGSLATGGFSEEDDIDLNIVTEDGRRYVTYLLANLLGLKYSLRLRHKPADRLHRLPLLPKVICVNVIVEEAWTRPFARQDEQMAFELMVSRPLFGQEYFRRMMAANEWVRSFFPQAFEAWDGWREAETRPTLLAAILRALFSRRGLGAALEKASKMVSRAFYEFVHWTRRKDPEAVARIEFIKRVKEPYEVFQD